MREICRPVKSRSGAWIPPIGSLDACSDLNQPLSALHTSHHSHHGLGWCSKLLNGLRAAASGAFVCWRPSLLFTCVCCPLIHDSSLLFSSLLFSSPLLSSLLFSSLLFSTNKMPFLQERIGPFRDPKYLEVIKKCKTFLVKMGFVHMRITRRISWTAWAQASV